MCIDFNFETTNIFDLFQKIKIGKINDTNIKYKEIFDNSTLEKTIILPDFQVNLKEIQRKMRGNL
ncbi:MAG: hypothetical protein Q9M97_04870 [Candidatus Gracilibacteria bacterium]|nr:hypothetical protein [Candidatus Gracilibacteria bacterium]